MGCSGSKGVDARARGQEFEDLEPARARQSGLGSEASDSVSISAAAAPVTAPFKESEGEVIERINHGELVEGIPVSVAPDDYASRAQAAQSMSGGFTASLIGDAVRRASAQALDLD